MSISTFAELKSSIADFLNRSDLTAVIPSFISLAEAQINRDVRHWKRTHNSTLNYDAGDKTAFMPADWVETNYADWAYTSNANIMAIKTYPLEYAASVVTRERLDNSDNRKARPTQFSYVGSGSANMSMALYPIPDAQGTVFINYTQKVPALSDITTTNWLLTDAPDVYLYGSLLHAAPYLQEDNRVNVWAQLYGAAVKQLNEQSDKAKYSSDSLGMRKLGLDTSASKRANHVRWS